MLPCCSPHHLPPCRAMATIAALAFRQSVKMETRHRQVCVGRQGWGSVAVCAAAAPPAELSVGQQPWRHAMCRGSLIRRHLLPALPPLLWRSPMSPSPRSGSTRTPTSRSSSDGGSAAGPCSERSATQPKPRCLLTFSRERCPNGALGTAMPCSSAVHPPCKLDPHCVESRASRERSRCLAVERRRCEFDSTAVCAGAAAGSGCCTTVMMCVSSRQCFY